MLDELLSMQEKRAWKMIHQLEHNMDRDRMDGRAGGRLRGARVPTEIDDMFVFFDHPFFFLSNPYIS